MKYNDGCTYNGIILTQQIGERVEADMHTFACFIDLKKAFDAVQRRLLRGRLRSFGVCGKLLRALKAGYGKRTLVGRTRSGQKLQSARCWSGNATR